MKLCFVTVGATASFELLLKSILGEHFLCALQKHDYTHLLIQYGKDGQGIFERFIQDNPPESEGCHGIQISGFDFSQEGLGQEMRLAQSDPSSDQEGGMIISHAGMYMHSHLGIHEYTIAGTNTA